jgi:hypothetical protein
MREPMHSNTTPRWQQQQGGSFVLRPEFGFAAATFTGFAAWAGSAATLHPDLVMPLVATVFFVFAGVFALAAYVQRGGDLTRVTYRDVAGALTLIGICAAATIEPEQLAALVDSTGGSHPGSKSFSR